MPASRVASSAVSAQFASGNGTLACPVNVSAGNCLPIVYHGYVTGTAVVPTITKSSGTATIGTPRLDGSVAVAIGVQLITCVFMVPITGSGTLTLQFTSGNGIFTVGWDEITGLDAIPVKDVAWTNSGNGTVYSTGAQAVAGAGIIIAGYADGTGANAIYSAYSDTPVWEQTNAANATGLEQEKIVSSAGSHTLTVSVDTAWPWQAVAVSYLAPGGAPPTYDPWLMADGVTSWLMADGVTDWVGALSTASGANSYSCVGSGGFVSGGTSPSSTTRSVVASGGLVSGGAAPSSRKRATIAAGGFASGGAAPATFARSYTHVATGGLTSGGAATTSRKRATVGTGGIVTSGTALLTRALQIVATGGLVSAGASPSTRKRATVASGGLVSAGAAPSSQKRVVIATGGFNSGGSATATFGSGGHANYTHTMSGGISSGGAALVRISQFRVASGGLTSGGAAPTRRARASVGAGGLVSGGVALLRRQSSVVGSGGLLGGGTAIPSRRRASIASGGGTFGGAGLAARRYGWTGTGGLVSGGAGLARRSLRIVGAGGFVSGGAAALRRHLIYIASGGLLSGGEAITLLTLAPTIGLPLTVIWGGRSVFSIYLEDVAERYRLWLGEAPPRYEVDTDDSVSAVTLTLEDS